jgi:hypothetical protein
VIKDKSSYAGRKFSELIPIYQDLEGNEDRKYLLINFLYGANEDQLILCLDQLSEDFEQSVDLVWKTVIRKFTPKGVQIDPLKDPLRSRIVDLHFKREFILFEGLLDNTEKTGFAARMMWCFAYWELMGWANYIETEITKRIATPDDESQKILRKIWRLKNSQAELSQLSIEAREIAGEKLAIFNTH